MPGDGGGLGKGERACYHGRRISRVASLTVEALPFSLLHPILSIRGVSLYHPTYSLVTVCRSVYNNERILASVEGWKKLNRMNWENKCKYFLRTTLETEETDCANSGTYTHQLTQVCKDRQEPLVELTLPAPA